MAPGQVSNRISEKVFSHWYEAMGEAIGQSSSDIVGQSRTGEPDAICYEVSNLRSANRAWTKVRWAPEIIGLFCYVRRLPEVDLRGYSLH